MAMRRKSDFCPSNWTLECSFENEEAMTLRSTVMKTMEDVHNGKTRVSAFLASWVGLKRGRMERFKRRYCVLRGSTLFCHHMPNERSTWYMSLVGSKAMLDQSRLQVRILGLRTLICLSFEEEEELQMWFSCLSRAGRKMLDIYGMMTTRLGCGAFSTVWLGFNKQNGEQVAIKAMNKSKCNSAEIECFKREMYIMQEVDNEHCVAAIDVFDTPEKLFIVQEFMEGGSIENYLEPKLPPRFSERNAKSIARDIFRAVAYLHSAGILHRDIKPDNLLFDKESSPMHVKLADFGFATWFTEDGVTSPIMGSPGYLAPEILERKTYGGSVDVWASGITVFRLYMGYCPFDGETLVDTITNVKKGNGNFDSDRRWEEGSPSLRSFIRATLNPDPEKRLTARAALVHPFLERKGVSIDSARKENHIFSRFGSSISGDVVYNPIRKITYFLMALHRLRELAYDDVTIIPLNSPARRSVFKNVKSGLRASRKIPGTSKRGALALRSTIEKRFHGGQLSPLRTSPSANGPALVTPRGFVSAVSPFSPRASDLNSLLSPRHSSRLLLGNQAPDEMLISPR